jgi:hypothetical protein
MTPRPVTFGVYGTFYTGNDLVVRRVSSFVRAWIFVGALAQAVLPGAIGVVDASAATDVACTAIRPHIESHGTSKCPRFHQEDTCALCQYVSGVVATQPVPPVLPAEKRVIRHVPVAGQELPTWRADGAPSLPRAPPVRA